MEEEDLTLTLRMTPRHTPLLQDAVHNPLAWLNQHWETESHWSFTIAPLRSDTSTSENGGPKKHVGVFVLLYLAAAGSHCACQPLQHPAMLPLI